MIKYIYENCDLPLSKLLENIDYTMPKSTVKKLKSSFSKFKKNEEENIKFIINNIDKYPSYFDQYFKLNRGTTTHITNLFEIKLERYRENDFTKSEDEFIVNNYRKLGLEECSRILGYSKKRILTRAQKLKVYTKQGKYSEEEKSIIKDLCEKGYTPEEISECVDRNAPGICNFIYRNNLKYNYSKSTNNRYYPSYQELLMIKKFEEIFNFKFPDKTDINNKDYYWNQIDGYEIDLPIFISNYKFAIEYDGEYWHNSERDKKKDKALIENGFIVFRVKGNNCTHRHLDEIYKQCEEVYKNIMALVKRSELTGTPLEPYIPSQFSDKPVA